MSSLRGRLLQATWTAVLVVGALSAVVTFLIARRETEVLLDGQMQRVALLAASAGASSVAGGAVVVSPPPGYETEDDLVVVIRDAAGRVLFRSHPLIDLPALKAPGFANALVGGTDYRTYMLPVDTRTVVVAQATFVRRESAIGAALGALLPVVLIVPILGLVIAWVVRRQLREVTRAARQLAERPQLSLAPLPADALPAEVQPLVAEFNVLLERVRAAIEREKSFIADAAHALRTPLTALQLQAQVLDGSTDPGERARRLAELAAGIRRIVRLSTQLLDLARYDVSSPTTAATQVFAVDEAIAQLEALFAPVAAERGVRLEVSCAAKLLVAGTATQLLLVLGNLLDNALRYSTAGAIVSVRVTKTSRGLGIQVQDEGPGIPVESLGRVFERFYRVPGDVTPGNGLGLATALAATQQLGGRVTLCNRTDRTGLVVTVTLPTHG